jgi:hypothetical protein
MIGPREPVRRLDGAFMASVSQRGMEGTTPLTGEEEEGLGSSVPHDA